MSNEVLEFGGFRLEPAERRLSLNGTAVEISQRYLDALLLLARHPGELITKDRFLTEVWRGVPVTDEALTQCVRSLRKALGDDATRPRFIETVPKHGYRFVAAVNLVNGAESAGATGQGATTTVSSQGSEPVTPTLPSDPSAPDRTISDSAPTPQAGSLQDLKHDSPFKSLPVVGAGSSSSETLLLAGAGLAGGGAAGLIGGIGYGLLAATDPPAGTGAISILLVMTCVCLLVGLVGGIGVGAGIGLGRLIGPGRLFPLMAGGALGGLVVGSLGRLIGLDAFSLLIGSRPLAITGGSEGLLIGALAGAAFWRVSQDDAAPPPHQAAVGGLIGALAGLLVTVGGGKMMAGSLSGLAAAHPNAALGTLLGDLSPLLLLAAGTIEGAIFIAALSLSFALVLRSRRSA